MGKITQPLGRRKAKKSLSLEAKSRAPSAFRTSEAGTFAQQTASAFRRLHPPRALTNQNLWIGADTLFAPEEPLAPQGVAGIKSVLSV